MAPSYPNLEKWLETGILPDLSTESRTIKDYMKKIEPDNLQTKLDNRMTETKLKTLINETLSEIRDLKGPFESLIDLGCGLVECEETDQEILQVNQEVLDLIETIKVLEIRKDVLSDLRETIYHFDQQDQDQDQQHHQTPPDLNREFKKQFENKLVDWNSLSTRKKFATHPSFKEFRKAIWTARGTSDVMPPVKSYLPIEEGDSDDDSDDEELAIGGGTQTYKCPLCIKFLTNPYRSKLCRHAFCQTCFDQHFIQNNSTVVGCPQSGCHQSLTRNDVELDERFMAEIKRAKRRIERQEAEAEEEEEEEEEEENQEDGNGLDHKGSQKKRGSQNNRRKRPIVVDDEDE
ncbi:uncharacterized protein MELLADRAFT_112952 [Melampsora larici-populina 98AG31]|uniref:Uncharacterized protein n=1 Tax=Melampsora larici-populina (strain 98AG31 / pathotype 3-4-7) TaxID=747676 RepID=F4S878_MELLP|nr:uncharacterized protein MELLADRAFT_112952 [Melampsora larici-populina 98AG31]EGF99139.1 hypothetical protein MELLADRAFT_112952 [Melampsora larici-populina 98AG31]